jgi:subtilisin family serine protease
MEDLKGVIEEATELGVVIVIAAGNHKPGDDDKNKILPPADMAEVITVGGVDRDGDLCDFSNLGDNETGKPDLVAPASIVSTHPDSYGGYAGMAGTSMAAPVVTGAIAILMAHNSTLKHWNSDKHRDSDQDRTSYIKKILTDNCRDLGDPGWDKMYGHGLLNLNACFEIMSDTDREWNVSFFIAMSLTILILCSVIYLILRHRRRKARKTGGNYEVT